ncbi:uncharacterized protein [Prorops nasuta]|uniref:uncharacterized protein n=1 Tax=Prorops nasuta TaxID=863751 RepID=UPI0034CDD54B
MLTDSSLQTNDKSSTDVENFKSDKIEELFSILKVTDRNLTICEEILASYIRRKLKDKKKQAQQRNELENKMVEILDNLKTRLLIE